MIRIAPSILAADFSRLGEEIRAAEKAGADMIHLDIMDGHFVPNLSYGSVVAKISKKSTRLPHDAHLMVTEPENHIESFARLGVEYISFHIEIGGIRTDWERGWVYTVNHIPDESRIRKLIGQIRNSKSRPGLAINPPTDIELVFPFLGEIELLLLMSVNPGFAGQKFIPNVYDKLKHLDRYRTEHKLRFDIMVDGGVGLENGRALSDAGADILVAGSSFFGATNYGEFVRTIKS